MSVEIPDRRPNDRLVDLLVTCPFCSTDNRLEVTESMLRTVIVHRGGGEQAVVDLSRRGALLDHVFEGSEPPIS